MQIKTSLSALNLDMINVKEYGAKGDNSNNDFTAIQAALSAAIAGQTVIFPPGTYIADGVYLQVPSGVNIEAHNATLHMTTGAGLYLPTCSGNKISGLRLVGQTGLSDKSGVVLSACSNIIIENCDISDFVRAGIRIYNGIDGIKVLHNSIHENDLGFELNVDTGSSSHDIEISYNDISSQTNRGIQINEHSIANAPYNILIHGNVFKSNTGNVVYISGKYYTSDYMAYNVAITSNKLYNNLADGIDIAATKNFVISDNVVFGSGIDGINVWASKYGSISNNSVMNCGAPGIMLQGYDGTWMCEGIIVSNNSVFNCNLADHDNMAGIRLYYAMFCMVNNNIVNGSMFDRGIQEEIGCDINFFLDNLISAAIDGNILTVGANSHVRQLGVSGKTFIGVQGIDPGAVLQSIGGVAVCDGITAPSTIFGFAHIYVDVADGDLKVKFGDGTVKTLSVDT
jgi:parallel beta-helix repeat protein